MWFARLFGGRKVEADEPARFAAPPSAKTLPPVGPAQGNSSNATAKPNGAAGKSPPKAAPKARKGGFDPYNSGSFDRSDAWKRVIRR